MTGPLADGVAPLAEWLVVTSLRVAVLYVAVGIAARALRGRGVRARTAFWRATLGTIAVVALLPPSLGGVVPDLASAPPVELSFARPGLVAAETLSPAAARSVAPERAASVRDARGTTDAPVPWRILLVGVWASGLASGLIRLAAGSVVLRRRLRSSEPVEGAEWAAVLCACQDRIGIRGAIELRATSWSGAPAVCGLLRPRVLLPDDAAGWTTAQRRAVLRHELFHLAHHDLWTSRACLLLRAVFWFHPAVQHATRQLERTQELRCDHDVVSSGVSATEYAASLVDVARRAVRRRSVVPSLPFVVQASLEERVRFVLASPARASRERGPTYAGLLLLPALASGWCVQAPAPDAGGVRPVVSFLPSDGIRHLDVVVNAAIRILPAEHELTVAAASSTGSASEWLEGLTFERHDGTLLVRDPNSGRTPPVSLVLSVPPTVTLDVHAANGDVRAELPRLTGAHRLRTSRGDVSLLLSEPGSTGTLSLRAGLGDVRLHAPDAGRMQIDAHAALGAVVVPPARVDAHALDVELHTGRGTVRATAP